MAFDVTASVDQDKVADYMVKHLPTALVSYGLMRHHTAGRGVDSFKIPKFNKGTVGTYTGADITFNDYTMDSEPLVLDQKKYSAPTVDIIDKYENHMNLVTGMVDMAIEAVAEDTDKYMFQTVADKVGVVEHTAYTIETSTIIRHILDMGVALSKNNVPRNGRKLFVPYEYSSILAEKNIGLTTNSANEGVRTGSIGHFGGFEIFETNNLADGVAVGSKVMIACSPEGGDFAQSLQHAEILNLPNNFRTAYKTLTSYGSTISNTKCYIKCDVVM